MPVALGFGNNLYDNLQRKKIEVTTIAPLHGEPVSLSPTEFTLLRYFIINAGTVLSKPKILDHVWRYDFGGDVNVVESYVSYLRRKIDTGEKRLLHTLRGVGYVLREPR